MKKNILFNQELFHAKKTIKNFKKTDNKRQEVCLKLIKNERLEIIKVININS